MLCINVFAKGLVKLTPGESRCLSLNKVPVFFGEKKFIHDSYPSHGDQHNTHLITHTRTLHALTYTVTVKRLLLNTHTYTHT